MILGMHDWFSGKNWVELARRYVSKINYHKYDVQHGRMQGKLKMVSYFTAGYFLEDMKVMVVLNTPRGGRLYNSHEWISLLQTAKSNG